jgi:hypothetical protein
MVMSTDKIIEILFGILVFTALIPTIATSVTGGLNLSGAALTLVLLIPLVVVIVFLRSLIKKKGR